MYVLVIWFCSPAAGRALTVDNERDNHITVKKDSWVFVSMGRVEINS